VSDRRRAPLRPLRAARELRERLLPWILDQLNARTPKRHQVLLSVYPDTDASLPPLLDACRDLDARVVVLLTDPRNAVGTHVLDELGARAAVYRRGSLAAAWQYLRSSQVLFTHPVHESRRLASRQTVVNIWHGMPIKAIGMLDGQRDRVLAHWTLAGSEHFRPLMAEAFGIPLASVVALHSPRIEHLSRRHPDVWDRLGIDRSRVERVVVWMPTFRGREVGEGGAGVHSAPLLSADGMARLAELLDRRRCLLVLRRHPYEARSAPMSAPGIVELTDAVLEAGGAGIYDVLAEADGLISDVSSVWLDFLVLDRPVIIYFPDVASYTADRRLLLDPYESWTPGPLLRTEAELLSALDDAAAGIDRHAARRREVGRTLVGTPDANLSVRVLALAGVSSHRSAR
jgi:CDP-glycerol glycerophosphotransferase